MNIIHIFTCGDSEAMTTGYMCIIFTSCFHVCLCAFTHTVGIAGVIHSSEQPLAYSAEKGLASAKAVSNQLTYKREGDVQHRPFAAVMQMTEVKQTAYRCRDWQLCRSTDDLPVQKRAAAASRWRPTRAGSGDCAYRKVYRLHAE